MILRRFNIISKDGYIPFQLYVHVNVFVFVHISTNPLNTSLRLVTDFLMQGAWTKC